MTPPFLPPQLCSWGDCSLQQSWAGRGWQRTKLSNEKCPRSAPNRLHFFVAWVGRRLSGDLSSSAIFHSESRFNLRNFFSPLGPRGVEFSGPIWSPARLFVNLANWAFVAAVPALYGAIYKFRKTHLCTTIGKNSHHQLLFFVTNPHITLQVQEHGKRPLVQSLDEGTPTLIKCF